MNRVRFLAKIAMVASIFVALTFTVSCSDDKDNKEDKDDNDGGKRKWCVIGGTEPRCVEIGAKYGGGQTMTEENCKLQYNYSIEDEKPSNCIVISE
jgi:hypothetical protein